MAIVFEDLIQETLMSVEGFLGDQDLYGTTHDAITATTSSFKVDSATFADGSGFSPGLIEVGDELVYVQSVDRTTGTLSGVLRGWRGTTAVAHPAGTLVRNNPKFPRLAVKRAINDTIESLGQRAPVIKTTEFLYKGARIRYDLPADTNNVFQVSWFAPGASKTWIPCKRWDFDATAGSTSTTGKAVDVWDAMPSRKVQVVYQGEAGGMTNAADAFTTTTGLPEWCKDLIIFGACYRLAALLDFARVSGTTVEQAVMNSTATYGSTALSAGSSASKYFFSLYQQRLAEVETRFQNTYKVARHYTR